MTYYSIMTPMEKYWRNLQYFKLTHFIDWPRDTGIVTTPADNNSYVQPSPVDDDAQDNYTITPSGYEEPEPGAGVIISAPQPLTETFLPIDFQTTRYGYVHEAFGDNTYDESWTDEGADPGGYGEVQFVDEDLKVGWGNVPYAFKKTLAGDDDFGDSTTEGSGSYIKDLALEIGQLGVIAEGILDDYDSDDPRYGSWIPDEVYFGVHFQGITPSRSIYIILAHTGIYESEFDANNSKEVVGPDTTTKLILSQEQTELIELKQYTSWLGGGVTEVSLVGPSGVGEDGNFNPTVFGGIPLPVTPWNYTTIEPTDETFDLGYDTIDYDNITIGAGGAKIFIGSGGTLRQYELSPPGDVTTASETGSMSVESDTISFSSNGEHFYYITGDGSDYYCTTFNMTTPWDITTASNGGSVRVSPNDVFYDDLAFNSSVRFNGDGTKAYILNSEMDKDGMYVGSLSTPWDMSTFDPDTALFYSVQGYLYAFLGFDPVGENAYFFVLGQWGAASGIRRYPVSTPWDINTMSDTQAGLSWFDGSNELPDGTTWDGGHIAIHPDGGFAYAYDHLFSPILRKYILN